MSRKFQHPTRRAIQRRRDQSQALAMMAAATLGLVAIFAGEAIGMNTANKTLRGELASVGASRAIFSFEGGR